MQRLALAAFALAYPAIVAVAFILCASQTTSCKEHHKKEKGASGQKDLVAYFLDVSDQKNANAPKDKASDPGPPDECAWWCSLITKTIEDPVAFFTLILSLVVWFQFIWMIRQEGVLQASVNAAERAANLARDEFLVSHPPRLIVRRVRFLPDKPGEIHYIIANVGESAATIESSNATVHIDVHGERPVFPPYEEKSNNTIGNHTINVKDQVLLHVHSASLANMMQLIERGSHDVMFLGWMIYKNAVGTKGYMAFARVYDPSKGGFVSLNGKTPEYDSYEYNTSD
jgi:hypothetical protein